MYSKEFFHTIMMYINKTGMMDLVKHSSHVVLRSALPINLECEIVASCIGLTHSHKLILCAMYIQTTQ